MAFLMGILDTKSKTSGAHAISYHLFALQPCVLGVSDAEDGVLRGLSSLGSVEGGMG